MLFPLRTDRPLRSTPVVNYALIALNIAVFLLQKAEAHELLPFALGLDGYALEPDDLHLVHFITYAFLHGGWMHLLGNMVFLYIFGNNVSDKLGQLGYLLFYLGGAVFAGIGYTLLSEPAAGGMTLGVVGASGAIAAVTGAFLVLFPNTNITVVVFFIIIGAYEIPALLFVPFFFFQDVLYNFLGESQVAHTAHIAGTVFGVLVSLGLVGGRLLPRDQWDLWGMLSRWNRRRQFRTAVAKGWDPYGTMPPSAGTHPANQPRRGMLGQSVPPPPPDPRTVQVQDLRAQIAESVAHRNLPQAATLYVRLRQIAPGEVMSRTTQLDIANQLAESGDFASAAAAYDLYLGTYPDAEQHAHIQLLTGLIYSRYLANPSAAVERITRALPRLTSSRDVDLANAELARLRAAPV